MTKSSALRLRRGMAEKPGKGYGLALSRPIAADRRGGPVAEKAF